MPRRALFAPIRVRSLKDTATELLTKKTLSGKIQPGERLNESELSRELLISRAPIPEALQQLLEQGLVMNGTASRHALVSLGPEEIPKINSVRLVLEADILRLAPRLAEPADLKRCFEQRRIS